MSKQNLELLLSSYIDHLEGEDFWDDIMSSNTVEEILGALTNMVKSNDEDSINAAFTFISDVAGRGLDATPKEKEISAHFFQSEMHEVVRSLVGSPSLTIRQNAVSTLSRTGSDSSEFLRQVIMQTMNEDPLMVPILASEASWLDRDGGYARWHAQNVVTSAKRLVRWAALDFLDSRVVAQKCQTDPDYRVSLDAVRQLAKDTEECVADCANYMLAQHQRINHKRKGGKPEELPEAVRQTLLLEPMTFFDLKIGFWRWMSETDSANYTVEQLVAFEDEYRQVWPPIKS